MGTVSQGLMVPSSSRRELLGAFGGAAIVLAMPVCTALAADRRQGPPPIIADEWPPGYQAVPLHEDAFGKPDDIGEAFKPIGARARVLVAQLAQGFNYLGQPSDFVTRYDIGAYGEGLKDLFEHASRAEKTREAYRVDRKIRDDREKHFDDQIRACAELQHQHEDEVGVIANTVDSNARVVAALNDEVVKQRDRVLALQDTFDETCRQFSQRGCDLGGILHAVSALVGIVSAVYTGGASLVATVGSGLETVRGTLGAAANAPNVSTLVADVRRR